MKKVNRFLVLLVCFLTPAVLSADFARELARGVIRSVGESNSVPSYMTGSVVFRGEVLDDGSVKDAEIPIKFMEITESKIHVFRHNLSVNGVYVGLAKNGMGPIMVIGTREQMALVIFPLGEGRYYGQLVGRVGGEGVRFIFSFESQS